MADAKTNKNKKTSNNLEQFNLNFKNLPTLKKKRRKNLGGEFLNRPLTLKSSFLHHFAETEYRLVQSNSNNLKA